MADLTTIQASQLVSITGIDGTGLETNPVNSDVNGNLLVKDYSNGPVSAGAAAPAAQLIAGQYNTTLPTLTNTQQAALQVDSNGRILANIVNTSFAVTQSTSPWITKDQSDGPVTPGAVASFSQLIGGQYNSTLPTLTTGQQASIQVDSSGRLITAPQTVTVGVADKTAFTYGTTSDLVIGGVYQDTSPTLTAGQSGAARLTTNRAFHVNLRDSSGNEKLAQQTSALSIPVVVASDQSPISIQEIANVSCINGNITVGTTAVVARVGASNLANREILNIFNNGSATIYWGTSTVTTANGTPIFKNTSVSMAVGVNVSIYLISASAGQDVRIVELS